VADPRGLSRLRRIEDDLRKQEAANRALRGENAGLARVVKSLSPPVNNTALEKAAREQLGFVKPDELLFKFE